VGSTGLADPLESTGLAVRRGGVVNAGIMPDTYHLRRVALAAGSEVVFGLGLFSCNHRATLSVFRPDPGRRLGQGIDHLLGQPIHRLL
jgi:hypothetical protein